MRDRVSVAPPLFLGLLPADTRGYPSCTSPRTRTRTGEPITGTRHPYHPTHALPAGVAQVGTRANITRVIP